MFRYIKAVFGIYDHKWLSAAEFFKKFKDQIESTFEIRAITDLHVGSEYQDNRYAKAIVETIIEAPTDQWLFSLGDIFDFVCAPNKNLDWMTELNDKLKEKLKYRARRGNHEADGIDEQDLIVQTPNGIKIWLDHGDLYTDSQRKRYIPYRNRSHGASGVKLAQVEFLDKLDWLKTKRPLPKGFIEEIYDGMVKRNADVFVCGHFHVEAQRYYHYKGKVIIILPAHQLNKVRVPKMKAVG